VVRVNQEKLAAKAWPVLVEVAKSGGTITYGELAKKIGLEHHRPISYVLGVIQEYCKREHLLPLTSLVINKHGLLGRGFNAWPIADIEVARQSVYSENWEEQCNPFSYASGDDGLHSLVEGLLDGHVLPERIVRQVEARGEIQRIFRTALLRAYKGRCAFCRLSIERALEACHIKPWTMCRPEEKVDISNGLLLCVLHHRLFDEGYLVLDDSYVIHVPASKIDKLKNDQDRLAVLSLNGEKIELPRSKKHWPCRRFIELRRVSA
jgi:putative restriction endonuclease